MLLEEGLHPAALVQELLALRPQLRELQEQNAGLREELAAFDAQFFQVRAIESFGWASVQGWLAAACPSHAGYWAGPFGGTLAATV